MGPPPKPQRTGASGEHMVLAVREAYQARHQPLDIPAAAHDGLFDIVIFASIF